MKKLRIYLDADEVLMDFMTPVLAKYNATYDTHLTFDQVHSWDLSTVAAPGTDIYQFMNEPAFFQTLEPLADAARVLKQLIEDGHDVFISTAAWEEAIPDKYESFKRHFPFMPFAQILMIQRKDILVGDILLDDGLHNIESSRCTYPVVMDKPWNRTYDGHRVSNLQEFYTFVQKIANS